MLRRSTSGSMRAVSPTTAARHRLSRRAKCAPFGCQRSCRGCVTRGTIISLWLTRLDAWRRPAGLSSRRVSNGTCSASASLWNGPLSRPTVRPWRRGKAVALASCGPLGTTRHRIVGHRGVPRGRRAALSIAGADRRGTHPVHRHEAFTPIRRRCDHRCGRARRPDTSHCRSRRADRRVAESSAATSLGGGSHV